MADLPSGAPVQYHQLTKHSPASVRATAHRLDFTDQPQPFKIYPDLDPVPLPDPAADTKYPAPAAVAEQINDEHRRFDSGELARLLTLGAGIRRVFSGPGSRPIYLRSYACAGALYPIEVYVSCADVNGVEPGLYHYSPIEDGLRQLRPGDPRPYLVRACGGRHSVATAPACIILSGIVWRTAWKYRARGYRHLWWDSGMILANLLALGASGGHRCEVVAGFDDAELNHLLGVDGTSEMALCLAPIGYDPNAPAGDAATDPPAAIDYPSLPMSRFRRDYDEVLSVHSETSLSGSLQVQLWQQDAWSNPVPPSSVCPTGVEKVIRRRGSKRIFDKDRSQMSLEHFHGILDHATHHLACDWGEQLTQIGAVVHSVRGVDPGVYAYLDGLDLIERGEMRGKGKFLCLDQDLGGDGAGTLFLFTDFDDAARSLGKRSYRAAQLNAGVVGGRLYLCAYACQMGATGLTFFDDEVRRFFSTTAEPMLVVAIGR
ncbi:MAG: SagB family peptide dehydrogenase [Actinomycetota bacterium]